MVHIVESVINRKYGGWFVRNTEHAQRVYDALKASPLPISKPATNGAAGTVPGEPKAAVADSKAKPNAAPWGGNRKVEFAV